MRMMECAREINTGPVDLVSLQLTNISQNVVYVSSEGIGEGRCASHNMQMSAVLGL